MMFFSEDIIILKALMQEDCVRFYRLHEQYRLSPGQIARSIQKFQAEGVLDYDCDCAKLTGSGREWILMHRKQLFLQPKKREWTKINEEYRPEINIQQFPPIIREKDLKAIIEDGQ